MNRKSKTEIRDPEGLLSPTLSSRGSRGGEGEDPVVSVAMF
jgi:hypothetical protein